MNTHDHSFIIPHVTVEVKIYSLVVIPLGWFVIYLFCWFYSASKPYISSEVNASTAIGKTAIEKTTIYDLQSCVSIGFKPSKYFWRTKSDVLQGSRCSKAVQASIPVFRRLYRWTRAEGNMVSIGALLLAANRSCARTIIAIAVLLLSLLDFTHNLWAAVSCIVAHNDPPKNEASITLCVLIS